MNTVTSLEGGATMAVSTTPVAPKRRSLGQFLEDTGLKAAFTLVAVAVSLAFFLRMFVFGLYSVPSESMDPTLKVGDRIVATQPLLDVFIPGPRVERGDIVTFKDDEGWLTIPNSSIVKRVIGLPGDVVEGTEDGDIIVNGELLDEPYLPEGVPGTDFPFYVEVPEGRMWVMGDNRTESADSRWFQRGDKDGTVSLDSVTGVVFFRTAPLSAAGSL